MRGRRRIVDEKMPSLLRGGGLDERSLVFWQLGVFEIRAAVFWPCSPSLCCPLDDASSYSNPPTHLSSTSTAQGSAPYLRVKSPQELQACEA